MSASASVAIIAGSRVPRSCWIGKRSACSPASGVATEPTGLPLEQDTAIAAAAATNSREPPLRRIIR